MWTYPKDSSLTDYVFLGNWGISEKSKNLVFLFLLFHSHRFHRQDEHLTFGTFTKS